MPEHDRPLASNEEKPLIRTRVDVHHGIARRDGMGVSGRLALCEDDPAPATDAYDALVAAG